MTGQLLFRRLLVSTSSTGCSPTAAESSSGAGVYLRALDVQPVQAEALEFAHLLAVELVGQQQPNPHRWTGSAAPRQTASLTSARIRARTSSAEANGVLLKLLM